MLPNDFHFIIRIHPNQKDKDLTSAKELEGLQSESITVVKANDIVDSYYLAMQSNLVITFGSQLSVESAYMGKQVIVFGNSNFESFNFTLNVGNDVLFASKAIKDFRYDKKLLLENYPQIKDEACLHMFARKNQGIIPKYLKKNSYYGGVFLIESQEKKILIDKRIFLVTKYLGAPFVLINIYLSSGIKKLLYTLIQLIKK